MRKRIACPACQSLKLDRYAAAVSPFLAERMRCENDRRMLLQCRSCGLAFYVPRPTDREIGLIYDGYRNRQYQERRQFYEPWYTREVNAAIGSGEEIRHRIVHLDALLGGHVPSESLELVLDYGGDRGQFIPTNVGAKGRFVYDISGVLPGDGIQTLGRDELQRSLERFDLVMCCHVLEHLVDPFSTLLELVRLTKHGGYIYVEVPYDSPLAYHDSAGPSRRERLTLLAKRIVSRMTARKAFFSMHEHLSYFTPDSLEAIVSRAGLEPLEVDEIPMNAASKIGRMLGILSRKNRERSLAE